MHACSPDMTIRIVVFIVLQTFPSLIPLFLSLHDTKVTRIGHFHLSKPHGSGESIVATNWSLVQTIHRWSISQRGALSLIFLARSPAFSRQGQDPLSLQHKATLIALPCLPKGFPKVNVLIRFGAENFQREANIIHLMP